MGPDLVRALDASNLSINVAMWAFASEYEDWRFLLASKRLDEVEHREAYGLVYEAIEAAGIPYERTPTLWVMEMSDRTIRDLRRQYAKRKLREGTQIGNQVFGDRFFEAGIVYRIR